VGLDPEELYKRALMGLITGFSRNPDSADVEAGDWESIRENYPPECHGCGCCEVVCPSGLPLSSRISASASRGN